VRRAPVVLTATGAGLAAVLAFHARPAGLAAGLPGSPSTGTGAGTGAGTGSGRSGTGQPAAGSGGSGTRTATGSAVNYTYGLLSVRVTVSGKKITSVTIASLNDGGNPQSAQIDQQSVPVLEQQALQAQSAKIQGVSGASFTTTGFEQSLQSALTKLGL
jgi:uncharacterized protein with FMN-binding domain